MYIDWSKFDTLCVVFRSRRFCAISDSVTMRKMNIHYAIYEVVIILNIILQVTTTCALNLIVVLSSDILHGCFKIEFQNFSAYWQSSSFIFCCEIIVVIERYTSSDLMTSIITNITYSWAAQASSSSSTSTEICQISKPTVDTSVVW